MDRWMDVYTEKKKMGRTDSPGFGLLCTFLDACTRYQKVIVLLRTPSYPRLIELMFCCTVQILVSTPVTRSSDD